MPKEDPLSFDYEGYLTDLIVKVEKSKSLNNGKEKKSKIRFFFPEFEEAVLKSIRNGRVFNGFINERKLYSNLTALYLKKFRQDRLDYFPYLKQILETEHGKNYVKQILPD